MSTLNWRCCAKNLGSGLLDSDILIREKARHFELNIATYLKNRKGDLILEYPITYTCTEGHRCADVDYIQEKDFDQYELVTLGEL